jgi:hypothetical protein
MFNVDGYVGLRSKYKVKPNSAKKYKTIKMQKRDHCQLVPSQQ